MNSTNSIPTGHKVIHGKFVDLSDYARPIANWIAQKLKSSPIKIYQVSIFHFLLMIVAAVLVSNGGYTNIVFASFMIFIKNIIDAVDGSLARIRNKPSRIGRFLDSNLDFVGNFFLFLSLVGFPLWLRLIGFLFFILQGSFFNFYYILFRVEYKGDTTSKVEEDSKSTYPYDNIYVLKILYFFYKLFYEWQDKLVSIVNKKVMHRNKIPALFVRLLSINGLGFQYLIITLLLVFRQQQLIFTWFILLMNLYLLTLLAVFRNYEKIK